METLSTSPVVITRCCYAVLCRMPHLQALSTSPPSKHPVTCVMLRRCANSKHKYHGYNQVTLCGDFACFGMICFPYKVDRVERDGRVVLQLRNC
jgi:hypothetical protein